MRNYNYASIDVGSNSINLLLARVSGKDIFEEETKSYVTGLGRELRKTNKLSESGMKSALDAFDDINLILNKYHIKRNNVIMVATEASRVATNSETFYTKVESLFGLRCLIISHKSQKTF